MTVQFLLLIIALAGKYALPLILKLSSPKRRYSFVSLTFVLRLIVH